MESPNVATEGRGAKDGSPSGRGPNGSRLFLCQIAGEVCPETLEDCRIATEPAAPRRVHRLQSGTLSDHQPKHAMHATTHKGSACRLFLET